jgi:hypothetical protein
MKMEQGGIRGSHSGIAKHLSFLACSAVVVGSRRFEGSWILKIKVMRSFETSGTTHPVTQRRITKSSDRTGYFAWS